MLLCFPSTFILYTKICIYPTLPQKVASSLHNPLFFLFFLPHALFKEQKLHAQTYTLQNPSTLSRVPEIAHPSECHLRVVFNGEDTHEGAESHYREGEQGSKPTRSNGTKQRGSFTSSSPRNGAYLDFSSRTRLPYSMATDCPGRRGVGGPDDGPSYSSSFCHLVDVGARGSGWGIPDGGSVGSGRAPAAVTATVAEAAVWVAEGGGEREVQGGWR